MSVIKKGNIVYLSTGSHNYYYDESLPLLGEGAMGIVYKGVEPSTRSAVAIKRVRDSRSKSDVQSSQLSGNVWML